MSMMTDLGSLVKLYGERKSKIKQRLNEFSSVLDHTDEEVFAEMIFCLLTPQSKARTCDLAVRKLFESGVIFNGDAKGVERCIEGVRFPENKAKYVVTAREKFMRDGVFLLKSKLKEFYNQKQAREWFVHNVKGFGYKEASHFLRNVGMGHELAILDKHILKNLNEFKVIDKIPVSLTPKKYYETEAKMKAFAEKLGIPLAELDLLLWSKETGEVFK